MKSVCIAIIPVRGGSKGIPRKNARLLNGKPLLSYAIQAAVSSGCFDDVIVTTDDEELEYLATKYGATVIRRPAELAGDEVGLDEVVIHAVDFLEAGRRSRIDYVATIQATSALISPVTIKNAVRMCMHKRLDTVVSVVEDTHLGWKVDERGVLVPDYEERVNRQFLPLHYRETGGIVVCPRRQLRTGSRFGALVGAVQQDKTESVDIDDRFDWWLAEKQMQRKSIVFRVEGNAEIGLGHVYRCMTLTDRMIDHDITFVIRRTSRIGINLLKSKFHKVVSFTAPKEEIKAIASCAPDIVINDILDTKVSYIKALKTLGCKVVNFEDQGAGRTQADVVINAMYKTVDAGPNELNGPEYACLRDEFYSTKAVRIREDVKNVLILFGGVDPSRLTEKTVKWMDRVNFDGQITVITGPGYRHASELGRLCAMRKHVRIIRDTKIISKYMSIADLAVTSAGRTVFELAYLGVPMIVMGQNKRELTHVVSSESKGIVNLGLGKTVKFARFRDEFESLLGSPDRRRAMHKVLRAYKFENGIRNVWNAILRA